MTHHDVEHADLDKHTDAELRQGMQQADEQRDRVEQESSEEALRANREQRDAIDEELRRREEEGS